MARGFGGRGGGGGSGGGGFGGGGMGQMQNLMKQATQMQKKIQEAQAEAESKIYEIESAGGAVKVKINGKLEVMNLVIDEAIGSDKETLQDALLVAMNEAIQKVNTETAKITEKAGGGMKIPGLF